jgi:nitrogen fixation NifU-like protein
MPDLEELYREIILDHYRSPRNRGELPAPPAHRVEGFNPLCGDEVVLTFEVEGDRISDIKLAGSGCSISQSSGSLMSAAVKGRSLEEVRRLIRTFKSMMSIHESTLGGTGASDGRAGDGDGDEETDDEAATPLGVADLGELAALQGVVKFPVRIKCATLSWNALQQGLEELAAAT